MKSACLEKITLLFWMAPIVIMCSTHAIAQKYFEVDEDIIIIQLKDSIFIHETWHWDENYGQFPSNGLIIVKNGKAMLIDTPMDDDKTIRLVNYINYKFSAPVTHLIVGHFHDDCLGGMEWLQSIDVTTISGSRTRDICKQKALPVAGVIFSDSLLLDFNGTKLHCRFLGAGHTKDNIIVWMPHENILFGGCLVKSFNSQNLGNLNDAVVEEWDQTILKVMKMYPDANVVVPGHGAYGGPELLQRTLELVNIHKSR
jgi:metallo-beta-lactamase class B